MGKVLYTIKGLRRLHKCHLNQLKKWYSSSKDRRLKEPMMVLYDLFDVPKPEKIIQEKLVREIQQKPKTLIPKGRSMASRESEISKGRCCKGRYFPRQGVELVQLNTYIPIVGSCESLEVIVYCLGSPLRASLAHSNSLLRILTYISSCTKGINLLLICWIFNVVIDNFSHHKYFHWNKPLQYWKKEKVFANNIFLLK